MSFRWLVILCTLVRLDAADEATGLWKTVDDRTGKVRGTVRIYEESGRLFGRVVSANDPAEAKERCTRCADERKDQPVVGMVILKSMTRRGNEYSGGNILDPDTGVVYRCKLTLADHGKELIVRGFIGFSLLGRNQIWLRQE